MKEEQPGTARENEKSRTYETPAAAALPKEAPNGPESRRVGISADVLMPVLCDLIAEGREVPLTVTGSSMQPFLEHGRDSVILSPLRGELRRGQIVLYVDAAGRYVLHRVIRIGDGSITPCGDGNMRPDPPVSPESVRGVVREVRRKGKLLGDSSLAWRAWMRLWGLHPVLRRPFLWAYRLFSADAMRDAA